MSMYYQEGNYRAKVMDQSLTKTKAAQNPMLVLQVRILAVETATGWMQCDQSYDRSIYLPCDPADERSQDRMAKKLRQAGWSGDDFTKINLIGHELVCECRAGEYNGQPSENWDLPLPGLGIVENDPTVAKALNSIMRKRMKAEPLPAAEDAPEAPEAPQEPQEETAAADIPF